MQLATVVDFASVAKAAFLHYPARGGILREVVAPEGVETHLEEAVVDEKP